MTAPRPGGAQRGEEPAGLLEAGGDRRVAREPRQLDAVEDHDAVGPAATGAVLGEEARQLAAAGDDGQPPAMRVSDGTVKLRELSEATNPVTSATSGLPECFAAARRTRS